MKRKLYESAEDYLECVLILSNKLEEVHSIDIVNDMGYSKPSISIAMKKLKEDGYILMNNKGVISLTRRGRNLAIKIYERHQVISNLLISLGVNEKIAYQDACKIEHDLSNESFKAIKKAIQK